MRELFAWLLRLTDLRPDQPGVEFGFSLPMPAWGWALVGVAAAGLAWWSYRRLDGPAWARAGLGLVRAALLTLLVLLACGPRLQKANETVERDRVVMLLDRSSSLAIRDASAERGSGARVSREQELESLLAANRPALDALSRERGLEWLGFDAGVFELQRDAAAGVPTLTAPAGLRSDLHGAVEQSLARAGARPLAGIVVFSDGRATDQPSRAALRKLAAQKIPVLVVPLGSAEPIADLAVRGVQGPGVAFPGDVVPIEAEIERSGGGAAAAATRVQLVDTRTGAVLQEQNVEWTAQPAGAGPTGGGESQTRRLTFTSTPASAGVAQWAVRIVQDAPDLVSDNDEAPVRVELVDRPLRVVYLDGYPRWEYRYLQAILTREKSLASSALLLAPGRRSIQEGNTPLDQVPLSTSEWDAIDVLVMGDVQPEVFSPEQIRQIRQRVAAGGAGLLWIGGASATPAAWRATPLGDLLPIQSSGGESEGLRLWEGDVVAAPTPLADRLGVLRLLREPAERDGVPTWWPAAISSGELGWPRLRWAQQIEPAQLKPGAETLAVATPAGGGAGGGGPSALVTTMRFGAGRIVYVATDEIWRWRFGRGEDYPERFWLQLIRLLGRESVGRSGKAMLLSASPQRAEVGRPVRVQAELLDQGLIDAAGSTLTVRVTRVGELSGATTAERSAAANAAEIPPADVLLRVGVDRRASGEKPSFAGSWVPPARGLYRAAVVDALVPEAARASVEIEAFTSDDELRRPETDHAALAELAEQTGGRVLKPADLGRLEELLPRRDVRITLAPDEHPLWDTPGALLALLLLFTAEWVGRRLIRLV